MLPNGILVRRGELFREYVEVLWDVGNFGFSSTGERLEADRIYLAYLDADGSDEVVIYTSYLYLNQLDQSPVLDFDVRDGGLVNVTDEFFPIGPARVQFAAPCTRSGLSCDRADVLGRR